MDDVVTCRDGGLEKYSNTLKSLGPNYYLGHSQVLLLVIKLKQKK